MANLNGFFASFLQSYLVVLSVPSAAHLRDGVAWAAAGGVRCIVFSEPDDDLGETAACTEPIAADRRRIFRRFPLWGGG